MAVASEAETISPRLSRIAELARNAPTMAFTSLFHHVDIAWMREAYRRTRKSGAVGVDGQTAEDFAADLEGNLQRLLEAAKSGSYVAPPVRRVHLPKGDGKQTRPIGIPTFADKVLQRAVVMLLEALYEQDFLNCSYGFRPGRSAQNAVDAMRNAIHEEQECWVLEVDLQQFFDSLDHRHLREVLSERVRDGVVTRLVGKWLHAGVLESGAVTHASAGTPQGGVLSPLLANVFLHVVIDRWFESEVKPRLHGRATLVRYADDFAIVLSEESDAQRVQAVLPKRVERFGLTLHPEKTRLTRLGRRPPREREAGTKEEQPGRESLDFLGFTLFWGRSLQGFLTVRTQTSLKSLSKGLASVRTYCREHRHQELAEQHHALCQKLRGHYGYFGRPGNLQALTRFFWEVRKTWRTWLDRRSHKARMGWDRFHALLVRWPLPTPKIHARAMA